MKRIEKLTITFLLIVCTCKGQVNSYLYKRALNGINGTWQKLTLPDNVLSKMNDDLSDLRVYGITSRGDTVEAPYLLTIRTAKTISKEVTSRIINTSHKGKAYYYTFEVPDKEPVNNISLNFQRQNFEWKVVLEGSNDQQQWFTVAENYRILSIKNQSADYSFTTLSFPDTRYRFFRLAIPAGEDPALVSAKVSQEQSEPGVFAEYNIEKFRIMQDPINKESRIYLELTSEVPVSYLKIRIKDTLDYYRHVSVQYVTDSVHSEKGWKNNYAVLAAGTLNSIEANEFHFTSTRMRKIQVVIQNGDNKPLGIGAVEAKGYLHELIIRITEPGNYFLAYGNPRAMMPDYDINAFREKIPASPNVISTGDEMRTTLAPAVSSSPFFKNKAWLWSVMGAVILLLGWFTLKMIRKSD